MRTFWKIRNTATKRNFCFYLHRLPLPQTKLEYFSHPLEKARNFYRIKINKTKQLNYWSTCIQPEASRPQKRWKGKALLTKQLLCSLLVGAQALGNNSVLPGVFVCFVRVTTMGTLWRTRSCGYILFFGLTKFCKGFSWEVVCAHGLGSSKAVLWEMKVLRYL